MRNGDEDLRAGGGGGSGGDGPIALGLDAVAVDGRLVPPVHVPNRYELYGKPVIDRFGALILLLLALPILLLVALAVFVRLGSPVLLRQPRVGKDGQVFGVYKFRTMKPDRRRSHLAVPEDRRRTHKHPEDPRLVGLGRFLRKWSLDELPQLLNVVLGDMSLVGPRPELVSIVSRHYAPWQHARHQVKPGLTGLWQVTERSVGEMHEHTHVDLEYVEHLNARTDFRILLLTIPAVLGRRQGF